MKILYKLFTPITFSIGGGVPDPVTPLDISLKSLFLNLRDTLGRMMSYDEVDSNFSKLQIKAFNLSKVFESRKREGVCDIPAPLPEVNKVRIFNFEMVDITYGKNGVDYSAVDPVLSNFSLILDHNGGTVLVGDLSYTPDFTFGFTYNNSTNVIHMVFRWIPDGTSETSINKMFKILPKDHSVVIAPPTYQVPRSQ